MNRAFSVHLYDDMAIVSGKHVSVTDLIKLIDGLKMFDFLFINTRPAVQADAQARRPTDRIILVATKGEDVPSATPEALKAAAEPVQNTDLQLASAIVNDVCARLEQLLGPTSEIGWSNVREYVKSEVSVVMGRQAADQQMQAIRDRITQQVLEAAVEVFQ